MTAQVSINHDAYQRASDPNRGLNNVFLLEALARDSRHRLARSHGYMSSLSQTNTNAYPLSSGEGATAVPVSQLYSQQAATIKLPLAAAQKLNAGAVSEGSRPAVSNTTENLIATMGEYDPRFQRGANSMVAVSARAPPRKPPAKRQGGARRRGKPASGRGGGCDCGHCG